MLVLVPWALWPLLLPPVRALVSVTFFDSDASPTVPGGIVEALVA